MEIESIANFGKFSADIVKFCKEKFAAQDKKLISIYQAYMRTVDRDDFIHTVQRYFA